MRSVCVALVGHETIGKGICRCLSAEHADNELELGIDDLPDGLLKKPGKEQNQLEVAIGDGMEFTIHGDSKNKVKKGKSMLNNINVSIVSCGSLSIRAITRNALPRTTTLPASSRTVAIRTDHSRTRATRAVLRRWRAKKSATSAKKTWELKKVQRHSRRMWSLFHSYLPIADSEEEGECDEGPLDEDIIIHADGDDVILEDSPADCCPDPCYLKFPILAGDDDSPFWQGWANLRLKTFQLIENKYFETAVITMILLSSLALVSAARTRDKWLGFSLTPSPFLAGT